MRAPIGQYLMLTITCLALTGCDGGGGSDGDSLVLEGTLTQGSGGSHRSLAPKHGAGERIGEVEVCALGGCSVTDDEGQWGFLTDGEFHGGEILFTIRGHGIDDSTSLSVPAGTRDATIEFVNNGGQVEADRVVADGVVIAEHGA